MGNSAEGASNCCQCEKEVAAPIEVPSYVPSYPTSHFPPVSKGTDTPANNGAREPTELVCPPVTDKLGQVPTIDEALHIAVPTEPEPMQSVPSVQSVTPEETDTVANSSTQAASEPLSSPTTGDSEKESLPKGWQKLVSKSTGKSYFYNKETGESTFVMPKAKPSESDGPAGGLPPGWVEMQSRSTGQTYYFNSALQKSQFDRPTA